MQAEDGDKFRSFRFACDRCRSHKLKCPQNPSSTIGACQRCARAKAQCTFSPRARPARSTQAQEKAIQKSGRRDGSQSPSAAGGAQSPPPPQQQQQADQQNGDGPTRWDPSWGQLASFDALGATPQATFHAAVSPSDFSAAMNMGGAFMDCSPFAEPSSSGPTLHHTPFNFQFDMNHFGDLPDCAGSIEPSSAKDNEEDVAMASSESSTTRPKEDCTRKLTALAVEFQRHLMLINSYSGAQSDPSAGDDDAQHWLSTYPIGEILCLSGDFASLLKPELYQHGRGASVSITCENDAGQVGRGHDDGIGSDIAPAPTAPAAGRNNNHPTTPESIPAAPSTPSPTTSRSSISGGVDTPMALLILNCYVSMIRIYSALFAHLYAHLRRSAAVNPPRTDPGLKFGELPAAGDDVSLRTYTAVRLLLGALQHSEELLDLPNDLRCVLHVAAQRDDLQEEAASSRSSSASDSGAERMDLAEGVLRGPSSGEIIASELARAVFRQEAQMSAEYGGGGLKLLRKNIEGVKTSLRQRMQL